MPTTRGKPAWQINQPTFMLSSRNNDETPERIDFIGEITGVLHMHFTFFTTFKKLFNYIEL